MVNNNTENWQLAAVTEVDGVTESGSKEAVTLYAEPIFHIGNFTITNSLLTSWAAVLILLLVAFVIRRRLARVPGKFQAAVETVVEGSLNMMDMVT
ncbi:MAG: hypothetical protein NUV82_00755, partial [Candidatus Komeilibacteria bacterium]|nr:hypothetical protein [Candidatus Komeilibacteria bacterium]